jgi:hypothetical protein
MLFNVANGTFDSCLHSVVSNLVVGDYHLQNNLLRGAEGYHFVGYKFLCSVHAKESRGFASGGNAGLEQGHRALASFSVKIR